MQYLIIKIQSQELKLHMIYRFQNISSQNNRRRTDVCSVQCVTSLIGPVLSKRSREASSKGRTPSFDARDPLPRRFPDDLQGITKPRVVPFHSEIFKLVLNRFTLPKATPWLCLNRSPHFQRYWLNSGDPLSVRTGIPFHGIVA